MSEKKRKFKFRRKPLVVEAERFWIDYPNNPPTHVTIHGIKFRVLKGNRIAVKSRYGPKLIAHDADWIVKDIDGQLYPWPFDIFYLTHEKLDKKDLK